jgi:NitT/TauT family transport system ATP-binding protein
MYSRGLVASVEKDRSNVPELRSGMDSKPPISVAGIHIDGVSKSYTAAREPVRALDGVSFDVRQGSFVSIVGPSGCGKSTLLLIVAGLIKATSGSVSIGGERVTSPYMDAGIVFQDSVLLDWHDVLSNILMQARFRKMDRAQSETRAAELLDLVGLSGFAHRRPYELSGGMKQRVAICRALLHQPSVLLMDEPFGALDALTRDRLNVELQNIWLRNTSTVLFVTHSISEAVFLSDQIIVMSDRPGVVLKCIDVPLARPRDTNSRADPNYLDCVREIEEVFAEIGVLRG